MTTFEWVCLEVKRMTKGKTASQVKASTIPTNLTSDSFLTLPTAPGWCPDQKASPPAQIKRFFLQHPRFHAYQAANKSLKTPAKTANAHNAFKADNASLDGTIAALSTLP